MNRYTDRTPDQKRSLFTNRKLSLIMALGFVLSLGLVAPGCGEATEDTTQPAAMKGKKATGPSAHNGNHRGHGADKARGAAKVMPVQSHPHGQSYEEWVADWWNWVFSLSVADHPLFDNADCSSGQEGHVWFIGGKFGGSTAERECTIPSGTMLFFPVINASYTSFPTDPEYDDPETIIELGSITNLIEASLTIDGQPVSDLEQYRVTAGVFEVPANEDFGIPPESRTASEGIYIMLSPLPVGEHTIEFSGEATTPFGTFSLDISYEITVVPRGKY